MTVKSKLLLIFIVVITNWLVASEENVVKSEKDKHSENKNITGTPVSVDSRFFDLGQLFGPLFSNSNQNRPTENLGTNYPQNPQFQPTAQGNFQRPNPGNAWGNPSQGNLNPQGFNPQGPNGPNQWHNPQFANPGGAQNTNYPDDFNNYPQRPYQQAPNGPNQWQNPQEQGGNQNPTYPNNHNYQFPGNIQNTPNWRPEYTDQRPNQFPNQGGSNGIPSQIQSPDQGQEWSQPRPNPVNPSDPNYQFPGNNQNTNWRPEYIDQGSNQFPNQGQEWSQPRPYPNPDQNSTQFPDQDSNQRPDNGFNNYPSNNNQYPGQDSNQGGQNSNGGGTLDDMLPPTNNGSGNAILGKPVLVPTTTVDPDVIFFNNSSESPLQRQCVQDCPATPEYNPICGTNNVTYFNPGKFVCARNCGVSVYVARRGVCVRRPM